MYSVNYADNQSHQTELEQSFRFVFRVAQLFGSAPYLSESPYSVAPPNRNKIREGCFQVLLAVWVSLLYFAHWFCAVRITKVLLRKDLPVFTFILYNMEMVTSLMNLSLIFFGCRYLSAKYEEFWNRTLDLTSDLKPFGGDLIHQSPARQHKAIVSVTTVLFLAATFCDFSSTATPIDSLISAGAYILPHWVLVIALTQYNFLVSLIREVLKCVNDAVKSITFNQSAFGPNLRLLAVLHRKIVTINYLVYDISKVFGYLFLSAVISMICVTSVQLLEAYQFSRRSRISYQDGLYFLYTMIWITMQFSQAMLFLLPNDMVKYEVSIL